MITVYVSGPHSWSGARVVVDGTEIIDTMDQIGWTDIDSDFVVKLVINLGTRLNVPVEIIHEKVVRE